jgi:hypothetical protein
MFPIHRYLYYRIYRSQLIAFGEKEVPEWTACFGVSFLMWVNLSCLIGILNSVSGHNISLSYQQGKVLFVSFAIALTVYNYLRFTKNYKSIVSSYIEETKRERSLHNWYILYYSIATIALVIVEVMLP